MLIRLAQSGDYESVMALMQQLNPADPAASTTEQTAFEAILRRDGLSLLVADDAGVLVGSCYLNVIPNLTRGGRPYALIENVVTETSRRNQGIGQALITEALSIAWQQDCYKVMLMSGRTDESVHAFYRKCGFDADEKQAYILRAT